MYTKRHKFFKCVFEMVHTLLTVIPIYCKYESITAYESPLKQS
jgi:hypothetical protein